MRALAPQFEAAAQNAARQVEPRIAYPQQTGAERQIETRLAPVWLQIRRFDFEFSRGAGRRKPGRRTGLTTARPS